ncbi:unnamed protein product [Amoebophrya sp. A120]|nr:unnamed protein product [Amoebophrya sp. A120]|eukprot:GSA120T00016521001.1
MSASASSRIFPSLMRSGFLPLQRNAGFASTLQQEGARRGAGASTSSGGGSFSKTALRPGGFWTNSTISSAYPANGAQPQWPAPRAGSRCFSSSTASSSEDNNKSSYKLLYEVNCQFKNAEIKQKFDVWLKTVHTQNVIKAGGPKFLSAEVFDVASSTRPGDATVMHQTVVHYTVEDEQALLAYLENEAPRLRADSLSVAKQPEEYTASRRVLKVM